MTILRLSRSQVRVLPGAQTAWSGEPLTRPHGPNPPGSNENRTNSETAGRSPSSTLHTLSTACWCQPLTVFDGHRNASEIDVDFEAISGDPIDRDGFPIEGATR